MTTVDGVLLEGNHWMMWDTFVVVAAADIPEECFVPDPDNPFAAAVDRDSRGDDKYSGPLELVAAVAEDHWACYIDPSSAVAAAAVEGIPDTASDPFGTFVADPDNPGIVDVASCAAAVGIHRGIRAGNRRIVVAVDLYTAAVARTEDIVDLHRLRDIAAVVVVVVVVVVAAAAVHRSPSYQAVVVQPFVAAVVVVVEERHQPKK